MLLLPPLDSLRFFEAAARHQGFARAAEELGVTPAAVAHRVRMLETHLDVPLFERRHRGVALELETSHRGVDPDRRDFDAWLAYTGETAAPRPVTSREDTLLEETLYEEQLLPVCSPVLLAARGRPSGPAELGDWPLLYDLGWDADWAYWCARQGQATPDLARALGFRLYSRYCQVDEKLVDRPPRYWARNSREPAMLGIKNGRRPQLDNTLQTGPETGRRQIPIGSFHAVDRGAHPQRIRLERQPESGHHGIRQIAPRGLPE